jgi:hypothetical protein
MGFTDLGFIIEDSRAGPQGLGVGIYVLGFTGLGFIIENSRAGPQGLGVGIYGLVLRV